MNRELQCEVTYQKFYNAKRIAMRMIFGDGNEEYAKAWDYAEAIRKYSSGSTAVVICIGVENPPPRFQRMYTCFQQVKEGFMAGCRPILGVDGAHLRGPYTGVLLIAVGRDDNKNIFAVAWAVVETENEETWTWFLKLLVDDLKSVAHALWNFK